MDGWPHYKGPFVIRKKHSYQKVILIIRHKVGPVYSLLHRQLWRGYERITLDELAPLGKIKCYRVNALKMLQGQCTAEILIKIGTLRRICIYCEVPDGK